MAKAIDARVNQKCIKPSISENVGESDVSKLQPSMTASENLVAELGPLFPDLPAPQLRKCTRDS